MSADAVFCELGARTNFSFLEGAAPAEEMVVFAKKAGLAGLGIADRNSVAGVVRAHAKAKVEGYPFQPGARLVLPTARRTFSLIRRTGGAGGISAACSAPVTCARRRATARSISPTCSNGRRSFF